MSRLISYVIVFVVGFIVCLYAMLSLYGKPARFSGISSGQTFHGAPAAVRAGSNPVATAAKKVSAYVVNIDTISRGETSPFGLFFGIGPEEQKGQGSGVIFSPDGYILTNWHVVRGAETLTVTLQNGKQYPAKQIGVDQRSDLAVIKIQANNLPYATFADSDDVKVGDWVIAVGSPLGFEFSVTAGVVSAIRHGDEGQQGLIQTDAAINQGNSGGALSDLAGNLVGINEKIATTSGGSVGLGFAIPSNTAKRVAEQLVEHGKIIRPWFGISYGPYSEELRNHLTQRGIRNLPKPGGAYIGEVVPGGPADRAGLRPGDIVLKLDGKPISATGRSENGKITIAGEVSKLKIGQRVTLEVWQIATGRTTKMNIRLEEAPAEVPERGIPGMP